MIINLSCYLLSNTILVRHNGSLPWLISNVQSSDRSSTLICTVCLGSPSFI